MPKVLFSVLPPLLFLCGPALERGAWYAPFTFQQVAPMSGCLASFLTGVATAYVVSTLGLVVVLFVWRR